MNPDAHTFPVPVPFQAAAAALLCSLRLSSSLLLCLTAQRSLARSYIPRWGKEGGTCTRKEVVYRQGISSPGGSRWRSCSERANQRSLAPLPSIPTGKGRGASPLCTRRRCRFKSPTSFMPPCAHTWPLSPTNPTPLRRFRRGFLPPFCPFSARSALSVLHTIHTHSTHAMTMTISLCCLLTLAFLLRSLPAAACCCFWCSRGRVIA